MAKFSIPLHLEHGAAGLQQDVEKALVYYRKAADEGNPQAQAYVGDLLAPANMAPEVAKQMRRCAAEQGDGNAANALGIRLKNLKQYQAALEAFQLGVAAGDSISAGFLEKGFSGPQANDDLYYLGQQKDAERARRYQVIRRILSGYSYAHPTVPEINDIVPLPPAPLPEWDGTLKWLEAREANIAPEKPSAALIKQLEEAARLIPPAQAPKPRPRLMLTPIDFTPKCGTGKPCPHRGYWTADISAHDGRHRWEKAYFEQGDIMPTGKLELRTPRLWPLPDKVTIEEYVVVWRLTRAV